MAAPMKTYDDWLSGRLVAANPDVDLEIFVSYINGILDTDTSNDEKKESLEEVLEQVVEEGREELCAEIIQKWDEENSDASANKGSGESFDEKLSEIMGKTSIAVMKTRVLTDEEKARKAAIIAQYDHVSDGEEDDTTDHGGAKGGGGAGAKGGGAAATKVGGGAAAKGGGGAAITEDWYTRNTNSIGVLDAEKEKREKSKQEHERKKEKDKLDREAQRQKQTDRKDTEKKRTQKGERRR